MSHHIEPNECKTMMIVNRQKHFTLYSTVNCILAIETPILFTYLQTKGRNVKKKNTTENINMNSNSVHCMNWSVHTLNTLYVTLGSVSPMLNGFLYRIQPGWIKVIRFA